MIRRGLSETDPYMLAPGVTVAQDAGDEITAFDARRGRYWRGNASASWILRMLEQPVSVREIVQQLCTLYAVEEERVLSDTVVVMSELRAAKLIRKVAR